MDVAQVDQGLSQSHNSREAPQSFSSQTGKRKRTTPPIAGSNIQQASQVVTETGSMMCHPKANPRRRTKPLTSLNEGASPHTSLTHEEHRNRRRRNSKANIRNPWMSPTIPPTLNTSFLKQKIDSEDWTSAPDRFDSMPGLSTMPYVL